MDMSQQQRPSHISSEGDLAEDTPVAVEPLPGISAATTSTNIGMSAPPLAALTPPVEFEGMDVDIPLNDLSDDDNACNNAHNFHGDDTCTADEAAGFASSVGSLSLDDHLAVAVASAAGDEASTTSAGTGASSSVRGRRPSLQQAHRRPSQRRRSSATSFEMHDSLIFEELNKLVEDDTDSEGGEDVSSGTGNQGCPPIEAIETTETTETTTNGRRPGRRGSSRSLASVVEDMELDKDDLDDDDNKYTNDNNDDNNKVGKKIPIVMQFEQRILDRLEQQDDKRSLVRTRSEASLHSGRSIGSTSRQERNTGSLRRLGDLSGLPSRNDNTSTQNIPQRGDRALRGSRAIQSERVLTGCAREVWPEIDVEASEAANATSMNGDHEEGNYGKKNVSGSGKKTAASNKFSIKSLFRGLGSKKNN